MSRFDQSGLRAEAVSSVRAWVRRDLRYRDGSLDCPDGGVRLEMRSEGRRAASLKGGRDSLGGESSFLLTSYLSKFFIIYLVQ